MNQKEAEIAFRCVETDVRVYFIPIRTALIRHGFMPSKFETKGFQAACEWYNSPERTFEERNAFWNISRLTMFDTATDKKWDEIDEQGETKADIAKREAAAAEYAKQEQEINMEVTRRIKNKLVATIDQMAKFCRAIADNGGDAETCHIAISSFADIEREESI